MNHTIKQKIEDIIEQLLELNPKDKPEDLEDFRYCIDEAVICLNDAIETLD